MSDSMPPLTLAQMLDILSNPNFKTYLVIGKANDRAWKVGQAAERLMAGIRSYLVKADAKDEIIDHFGITPKTRVGIVFGLSADVKNTLTTKQAEDFLTVATAIEEA